MNKKPNGEGCLWLVVLALLVGFLLWSFFSISQPDRRRSEPVVTIILPPVRGTVTPWPTAVLPPPPPIYRPTPTPTPLLSFNVYAPTLIGGAAYSIPERTK